jgi:hypothetical protein
VVHVFQPLKVTDSNTTGIAQDIWQELDPSAEKNFFSLNGCWSIGSLDNQLAVESVSVVSVNRFFESSWHKDVAKFISKFTIPCKSQTHQ